MLVDVEIKLSTWPEVTIKYSGTLAGKSLAGEVDPHLRPQYLAEKRAALEDWANHLAVVIAQASGANVVKLPDKTA